MGLNINIEDLKNAVKLSESINQVMNYLGFDPYKGNVKKNIERLIKANNIDKSHFNGVRRILETKQRYAKETLEPIVLKNYTYKGILLELGLLNIESNYKTLKKYIKKYEIDTSHLISKRNGPNISHSYTEEQLRSAISNSKTLSESMLRLGIRAAGGNYKTIHRLIKELNINTNHFVPDIVRAEKLKKRVQANKKDIKEILTENSNYCRKNLKKRLYDDGLKNRYCELCGQGEVWNGKKLSLILDHINGIYNDNRLINLRIVCPNCNATLDTHCGKNNKK